MTESQMSIETARFNMIEQQIRPWDVLDPEVLKLLAVVRREDFVPPAYRDLAFADLEIPLGTLPGQVMLAPRIEARMLQEADVKTTDTVLEVGAGSGFMAALLAAKVEFVCSVEIDADLAELARSNLASADVANVRVENGDASHGWAKGAPYDIIILSGSTPSLPDAFLRQLKVGGRLLAVVGEAPAMRMRRITRREESVFETQDILETVVAPLINAAQSPTFVF